VGHAPAALSSLPLAAGRRDHPVQFHKATVLSLQERAVSFWCKKIDDERGLQNPPPLPYFGLMKILMAQDDDDKNGGRPGVGLATRTRPKTQKPSLYKVLLLNDDYTPMEFVVHVLKAFFQMDTDQATRVMIHVHQKGVGVCGIFTYEVAETKVTQVMDFAQKNQHPLQCTLEKD
jgi:ATP-dependent Clp protease adaptor protein ClpS